MDHSYHHPLKGVQSHDDADDESEGEIKVKDNIRGRRKKSGSSKNETKTKKRKVDGKKLSRSDSQRYSEPGDTYFSDAGDNDDELHSDCCGEKDLEKNFTAGSCKHVNSYECEHELNLINFLSDESEWEVSDFNSSSESEDDWKPRLKDFSVIICQTFLTDVRFSNSLFVNIFYVSFCFWHLST